MNNERGKVIVEEESRIIHYVTSGEMGETITVVAWCNFPKVISYRHIVFLKVNGNSVDTSGNSFDEDNSDEFVLCVKGPFMLKKAPNVTGLWTSNATNGCKNAMIIICSD
ncbi:hypothetical protein TNIN_341141 [Trichonephila inaurata madagascariensis]|uniref:Uncharacterized protein n=1 Tax=Trichonephila inaurata madagascariensis TaxID=2747483 RepID=A0A8X6ITB3_9ARAC|nr:hypothetical protein TNIN_341141 [Trichonephila inaurata madagascariensis]